MKALAITTGILLATVAAASAAADSGANAVVGKAHGGHIWIQAAPFPTDDGAKLSALLGALKSEKELTQKGKDTPWKMEYLAVFKKPSVKGPLTVQFFDKADASNIVEQYSPQNDTSDYVFRATYELQPDSGFNKGRTYLMKVGQILNGKFAPYATAEFKLK